MMNLENNESPFVSVVIPAYNAGECIGRAIDSVLSQTYRNCEIIVVDDGSTDDTAEVVKKYGSRVHFIHQTNAGASVARNAAIAAAKGQWIAFLDADDEWLPDKLRLQIDLIHRNPDLRWCGANYYKQRGARRAPAFNTEAVTGLLAGKDYFENYFRAAAKIKVRADTQTMMVRKDVFDELGGFEPERIRGQDLDVWWRIAHKYSKTGYIAEPLAIMHLDVHDPVLTHRRLITKRGDNARVLVARHLKLAAKHGCLDDFKAYASREMRRRLLTMIYNGFGLQARQTITQFRELFGWHWRFATYILTIFPKATATLGRAVAYLAYLTGLDRQVTRRWLAPETSDKNCKNN